MLTTLRSHLPPPTSRPLSNTCMSQSNLPGNGRPHHLTCAYYPGQLQNTLVPCVTTVAALLLQNMSRYSLPPPRSVCPSTGSNQGQESLNARSEYVTSQDDGVAEHRINQYVIKQEIGRGSFGAVHLAVDQFGTEYVSNSHHSCPISHG